MNRRKFIIKLVPDTKLQNKVYYYTMSESENIIDLILMKKNITKVIEGDDESHPIMIELEENSTLSNSETEIIFGNLKGKFLDKVIVFYKNKCYQYIE